MSAEIISTKPEIIHEGIYRLYRKPDGGMRIVYKRDDKDTEDFLELPGGMIALAEKAAKGELSLMDMVKETMKIMGGMPKL